MSAPRSALRHSWVGLRARRVAVRGLVPAYWYFLGGVIAVFLGMGIVLIYQNILSENRPRPHEVQAMRDRITELNAEVDSLKNQMGTAPNVVLMEQATQQALAQQLEKSQAEVVRLREELSYCEKAAKRDDGVRRAPIVIPGAGTIPANRGTNQTLKRPTEKTP